MQRHKQFVSVTAAVVGWLGLANAALAQEPAWVLVEARNHVRGTSSPAAVVFGVAQERGQNRPASLRVDCFEGVTAIHVDTVGLGLGSSVVAMRYSLDGGRYVSASWQASVDGSGLELLADRAVDFLAELYGKADLRLAVVRPLSVPFVLRFTVSGADQHLRTMAQRCHWPAEHAVSETGH